MVAEAAEQKLMTVEQWNHEHTSGEQGSPRHQRDKQYRPEQFAWPPVAFALPQRSRPDRRVWRSGL
jgi:hypothetical protein